MYVTDIYVTIYILYYFLKVLYKSLIYYCYVVLAAFMYNNCKALRAGKYSYDHLGHPALLGPVERGSGSSMGKAAVISGGSSSSCCRSEM